MPPFYKRNYYYQTTGTTEKDETGFAEGDLELLFAENQDDDG